MSTAKSFTLTDCQAAIAQPGDPGDTPSVTIVGMSHGVLLYGREALEALAAAIEHALGSESCNMRQLGYAAPEDLVEDGHSHSFTVHQVPPANRTDWVPMFIEGEDPWIKC